MVETTEQEDLVVFGVDRSMKFAMDNAFVPSARPSKTAIKNFMKTNEWFSPWGERDNLWPLTIMDSLRACAPAQVCIQEILAPLFYGNGLRVYERKGKEVEVVWDKDQQTWFRQSNINNYLFQSVIDYFSSGNQFTQLIRNKKTDKPGFGMIANISFPFCRLSAQDEKSKKIKSVFINGSWDELPVLAETESVPLLNFAEAEDILSEKKYKEQKKFMWHTGCYTPGSVFYHDMPWHALIRNGTIDTFPEIPKIRKARIKNAMFIKYHVRFNEIYWYLQYGSAESGKAAWEKLLPADRKKIKEAKYQQIDAHLAGSDNAFKSIFSPSFTDRNGNEVKLLTIEKVDLEAGKDATFDPDKMSAVADVFLAMAIPSAVANTVLSDSKSRGGGSDIREGNSLIVTRMPMHRDNVFQPVDFAMRNTFVGSNATPLLKENQFLGIENTVLTTLDESKNGTKKTEPVKPD